MVKKLFLNEIFILSLILLNALIVFVSAFDIDNENLYKTLRYIDFAITLMFVLELVVKVGTFGFKKYISSNWDKLDFVLILLSIPSILLIFEHRFDFSFLLVFRVLRVFKFFRFIKFIPGIDELLEGIGRALKTSLLVILGFTVYLFIISLFSCYLFKESSPEFFGDPLKSIYSIFRVFTVEGWYEIPDAITGNSDLGNRYIINLYFITILITGGILGLSLVNSIFVDAMVSDNNDELIKKVEELDRKIERLLEQNNKQDY